MMKYFKLNGEVFAFEPDQMSLVTPEMVEMTVEEIDRHLNPPQPPIEDTLPPLTRRQFKLALFDNGLLQTVESSLTDPRIAIEYAESTIFERNSPTVVHMLNTLGLTNDQVNKMWQQALTL